MGVPLKQIKATQENNVEKKVKDIMHPLENFSSVSADTSVRNAVYVLKSCMLGENANNSLNYLLVFENKSLIGFVGVTELLAAVQPPNLRDGWYLGWNVAAWAEPVFIRGLFTNLCHEMAEKPVKDLMEPAAIALRTDSNLEEAVFKFYREKRDMLPVVDNDRVVGILRAGDLFAEMANIIC